MDAGKQSDPASGRARAIVERTSEREFVVLGPSPARRAAFSKRDPSRSYSSDGGRPNRSASS